MCLVWLACVVAFLLKPLHALADQVGSHLHSILNLLATNFQESFLQAVKSALLAASGNARIVVIMMTSLSQEHYYSLC